MSVDPLTDEYPWYTPYQFAGNNPIANIDLDGLENIYYKLVPGLSPSGDPALALQKDREETTLNGIIFDQQSYIVEYNGEEIGQYGSVTELKQAVHGRTPSQIAEETSQANLESLQIMVMQGDVLKGQQSPQTTSVDAPKIPVAPKIGLNKPVNPIPKPTVDPFGKRVKLQKATKEKIKANAPKTEDGKYIDPNTKKPIEPGQEDFGHKPGHEWAKYKKDPANQNKTRKEVIKDQNDPDIYQIEDRKSNQSHQYEQKD